MLKRAIVATSRRIKNPAVHLTSDFCIAQHALADMAADAHAFFEVFFFRRRKQAGEFDRAAVTQYGNALCEQTVFAMPWKHFEDGRPFHGATSKPLGADHPLAAVRTFKNGAEDFCLVHVSSG